MEQNSLVERRGRRKHPNQWASGRINNKARDYAGLVVGKIKAKKELTLARDARSRKKKMVSQRRSRQSEGAEWHTGTVIAVTARRRSGACRGKDHSQTGMEEGGCGAMIH